jgi:hypothetical protein
MAGNSFIGLFRSASPGLKLRLGSLLLMAFLVSLASGWAVARIWVWHRTSLVPAEVLLKHRERQRNDTFFAFPYEIRNVAVPLTDHRNLRSAYAQFTLVLDCPNPESHRLMELNHAKILNTLFETASTFYVEDFETPTGHQSFKGALQANFKVIFKDQSPRDIAFRDWVIN